MRRRRTRYLVPKDRNKKYNKDNTRLLEAGLFARFDVSLMVSLLFFSTHELLGSNDVVPVHDRQCDIDEYESAPLISLVNDLRLLSNRVFGHVDSCALATDTFEHEVRPRLEALARRMARRTSTRRCPPGSRQSGTRS